MTSSKHAGRLPTALQAATYAVTLLEDDPLFNSGHGAVFTRDGINELEASVMVSRGFKKRAVGVSGIRRIRNPIQLASKILEAGEDDLEISSTEEGASRGPDVPSAQGHGHLHGPALTETLALRYGLDIVDPSYFFTQKRWDQHMRSLEREQREGGAATSWECNEYLPQGTCGAVASDEDGVICVATSTGGLTNKLTGRIGDTPTVGAGFWAEEWDDEAATEARPALMQLPAIGTGITLGLNAMRLMADCLPVPSPFPQAYEPLTCGTGTTRAFAASGTGNGDSFLRVAAVRTVAARARWKPESSSQALSAVAGRGGELQRSAGDRWGRTGEGEGGMIGIELVSKRDGDGGIHLVESTILQDFNCGGMFRAWIDDSGAAQARVWRDDTF